LGEPGGHSTSQRAPEDNYLFLGEFEFLEQVIPGSLGISISTLLIGTALTFPVSPIIKYEYIKLKLMKKPYGFKPVGYIPGISVAE
jgi:hypothetical protein